MKVKKDDVQKAVNALGRVPFNKVRDAQLRYLLASDYRKLRKVSREIEAERTDILEKFRADFRDEWMEVKVLRDSGRPVTGYDAFLRAEITTNRILQEMYAEEVDVPGLETVGMDEFLQGVRDGEFTFEDIACLDGIIIE